jgi:hypothetical protein
MNSVGASIARSMEGREISGLCVTFSSSDSVLCANSREFSIYRYGNIFIYDISRYKIGRKIV